MLIELRLERAGEREREMEGKWIFDDGNYETLEGWISLINLR